MFYHLQPAFPPSLLCRTLAAFLATPSNVIHHSVFLAVIITTPQLNFYPLISQQREKCSGGHDGDASGQGTGGNEAIGGWLMILLVVVSLILTFLPIFLHIFQHLCRAFQIPSFYIENVLNTTSPSLNPPFYLSLASFLPQLFRSFIHHHSHLFPLLNFHAVLLRWSLPTIPFRECFLSKTADEDCLTILHISE